MRSLRPTPAQPSRPACHRRAQRGRCPRRLLLLAAFVCTVLHAAPLHAQSQPHQGFPNIEGANNHDDMLDRNPDLEHRLQRSRESDRQKRIVDESRRLVELATLYRKSVAEHGTPTPEDDKLLLQMEKLAHDIHERTRGI